MKTQLCFNLVFLRFEALMLVPLSGVCNYFFIFQMLRFGALMSVSLFIVVKALCYKPEGHGFDT
jgi:hypothetical protein